MSRAGVVVAAAAAVIGTGFTSPAAQAATVQRTPASRLVSYDGIGAYRIGQRVGVSSRSIVHTQCAQTTVGRDGVSMVGTVVGRRVARVDALYVSRTGFVTPSGAHVGTTLPQLKRIYGNRLAVARKGHPIPGLEGMYQDVAAVHNASRAITFYLSRSGKVTEMKVSRASWRGDDEGCY